MNTAYASYSEYPKFSYHCIDYLMNNNEDIWKLLKYGENTALIMPNLTLQEKAELIYDGSPDTTKYRVFLDRGQDDALTQEQCIIKISPTRISPVNRTVGKISMLFEVYCHYKMNHIKADSYYTTRIDYITQQIIQTLNGSEVGGLGVMYLNASQSKDNGTKQFGASPWKSSWLVMSNNSD